MYVCVCNAVGDQEVRGAIALGARSLADLSAMLGVATRCGRCADCACRLMREACPESADCAHGGD